MERLTAHVDREAAEISDGYGRYFSSGLYDRRYPEPNRHATRRLLRCLPMGGSFLDFGTGVGRYVYPLLQQPGVKGVAYDICPVALRMLSERMGPFIREGRLTVRDDGVDALIRDYPRAFDLVLLMFAVLGHVGGRQERQLLLRAVNGMLKPGGALVLSVPNAKRRFLAEQGRNARLAVVQDPADVVYTPKGGDVESIRLPVHLYTVTELRQELRGAGFEVERIEPQSVFNEDVVVGNPLLGWIDGQLCRVVPAAFAPHLLAVARS